MTNYTPSTNFILITEDYSAKTIFVFEDTYGAAVLVAGNSSKSAAGVLVAADVDSDFANVTFLLQSSSGDFVDRKGHAVTVHGNPYYSASEGKFSTGSFYFDGVDDFLSCVLGEAALGSQGFTVEFWFKRTSSDTDWIFNCRTGVSGDGIDIREDGYATTANNILSNGFTVSTNVWHHFLIARFEGAAQIATDYWLDGVWKGRGTTSNDFTGQIVQVGGSVTGNVGYFQGYIDQVRVTKGVQRYKNATDSLTRYPLGNTTVNPFPTITPETLISFPAVQSYSETGTVDFLIGSYLEIPVIGVSSQGLLGVILVQSAFSCLVSGVSSGSSVSISVECFSGKDGNSVDLYFGEGWPSQTASDLKLHFYRYQLEISSTLDASPLEAFGTVPKVEGFVQFDFTQSYLGADAELIVFSFTSVTDYLDAVLAKVVPHIYGDSSNTAVLSGLLDGAHSLFLGTHNVGSLSSTTDSVSLQNVGFYASGTLERTLANVSSAFTGKVPVPIDVKLLPTMAKVTGSFVARYSSGELNRLLDNVVFAAVGTTVYRGYLSGTLEGINRNITGEFHSPIQGTFVAITSGITTQIQAYHAIPITVRILGVLSPVYVEAEGGQTTSGILEIRLENYYEKDDEFALAENVYYLPKGDSASLHFRQPQHALISTVQALHSNGVLSATTGASVFTASAGVEVSGEMHQGWEGYSKSTEFELVESAISRNLEFRFKEPNSLSASFIGAFPATVNTSLLGAVSAIFSGWTEVEGVLCGDEEYTPRQPHTFQFSHNRAQQHEYFFYWKVPSMQALTANIQALTLYGPYGRLTATLGSVSANISGFGHIFGELVSYRNNSDYSKHSVLDFNEGYEEGASFAWWKDSLGLSTAIIATSTNEFPIFHEQLEDFVSSIVLQTPAYPRPVSITGRLHNHNEYSAPLPEAGKDFVLEIDDLRWFSDKSNVLGFDRSSLDFSAGVIVLHTHLRSGNLNTVLSEISAGILGTGEILGYWGGEYEPPQSKELDFEKYGWYLNRERDFLWNYSPHLEDASIVVRGGEVSGYLQRQLSTLLPVFRMVHPVSVSGIMSGTIPGIASDIKLATPVPVWVDIVTADAHVNVLLQTWLNAKADVSITTGKAAVLMQGRFPTVAYLHNYTPLPVSSSIRAQTIIKVVGAVSPTLQSIVWSNLDASRKGTISITSSAVSKVDIRGGLSVEGEFEISASPVASMIGGIGQILGSWTSILTSRISIDATVPNPVHLFLSGEFTDAQFSAQGLGSIYGAISPEWSDELSLNSRDGGFLGFSEVRVKLLPITSSTYANISGITPGRYYGGLSSTAASLTVSADIRAASFVEGQLRAATGNVSAVVKGSTTGLFFRLHMDNVSSDINLRGMIQAEFSKILQNAVLESSGIVPKAVTGFFEAVLDSPISYIKLYVRASLEMSGTLQPVVPQIYGAGASGSLTNSRTANVSAQIAGARQGPLFASSAVFTSNLISDISGEVSIFGRFENPLQKIGPVFVGRVPIPYYGGLNAETRGLKFEARGTRYYYTYVDIDSKLTNISSMLKVFVPYAGKLFTSTEDLHRRIVGITPIAVKTIVDIQIGSGFYTEIKATVPTKGFISTATLDLRPWFYGVLFVGKLKSDLSRLSPDFKARVPSNTKVTLAPITNSPQLQVLGVISTEGFIDSSDLGEDLSFSAEARVPPQYVRTKGTMSSNGLTVSTHISGTHHCYKLDIDIHTLGVSGNIKAWYITSGVIDQELYTILPGIVGEFQGTSAKFNATTASIVGRFKAAFLVFGYFIPTLENLSLKIDPYIPSLKAGKINIKTDYINKITSTTNLETSIYGVVPQISHGRMDTAVEGVQEVRVQGRTPINLFGVSEMLSATCGIQIEGYCDIAGIMSATPQVVDGTFVGINNSFVLEIVMDRNDKTLVPNFVLTTPGDSKGKMFLRMGDIVPRVSVISEVLVKFDIKTSPFRLSRIVGDLGVVGMIIGGDIEYGEWTSSHYVGPTIYDYRGAGGTHHRKKISDIVEESGRSPGDSDKPENKKFWTLGYVKSNIVLHHPVPANGEMHNYWTREEYLDDWWMLCDSAISTYSGMFLPNTLDNRFVIKEMEIVGYVPIQGTMNINMEGGYDLNIIVSWPLLPGFQGYLGNFEYKATIARKLRDLKPEIVMDMRSFEAQAHNSLHPAKFLAQGISLAYGSFNSTVELDYVLMEMTAPHATSASMDITMESPLSRIKVEVREYVYGVFFQSFFVINEDEAEVDAEYLPTRMQFHGRVLTFGNLNIKMDEEVESWVLGDIRLSVGGTYAVIKGRLGMIRPRISAKHVGFAEVLAGMTLTMDPVSSQVSGTLKNDGWMSLRSFTVIGSILATAPFVVKGVLGEQRLEYAGLEMNGVVELWGSLSLEGLECTADIEAGHTQPLEGNLESALAAFITSVVACIPAEATMDESLDDVLADADFNFGPKGDWHTTFDDLLKSIFLNRYYPSDVVPPEYGKEIAGDLLYNYDRNKGSTIRIYDDSTEEVLFVSHRTSEDTDYSFANVMEGEYYVVGVPSNQNSNSEVLDELTVELEI